MRHDNVYLEASRGLRSLLGVYVVSAWESADQRALKKVVSAFNTAPPRKECTAEGRQMILDELAASDADRAEQLKEFQVLHPLALRI